VAEVAGWHECDSGLLIYDNYDIWQVDPSGIREPVNITNGYGLANHMKFRLVYGPKEGQDKTSILFKRGDSLLLTAFSPINKFNGFYRKVVGEKDAPKMLTMGPYTWYHVDSQIGDFYEFDSRMQPLKAADANIWIVKRESAEEAPNYFVTKDFKSYGVLSNIQPQVGFNWLTTELVNWKQLDGTLSQGILYKPENFDPHKKYPIIFNYYEYLSHRLYEYPNPEFTGDNINIPWFVSNGYLVFTPDIHYAIANASNKVVGEWAYNSVISAANYLAKLPYVDAQKMAIQGHSFGGLETNYLLTHTHLFAAAAEVAGSSDPISAYLTLLPFLDSVEHYSKQVSIETGHELYGATPWQRPDLYRRNSAVLNADQVTTPLLIMHNVWDNNVQWRQGVEFYMALRRLGKKVWMLQYDYGDHSVSGKEAVDYTIRLTQFFSYYLKESLPPKWMIEGVPASRKGIDTGLELDYSGKKP
jgi:dienelactone hydrolase